MAARPVGDTLLDMKWDKEEEEMIAFLRTRGWTCDDMGCSDPQSRGEQPLRPREAYAREIARQPRNG